ncbi:hypothetical protein BG910_11715 [Neisseria chenwenguii]|uniref:Uncharacterized protein n=1 Tax=Neisseria chenwenguii TaxID=1853278 RepID=A0A220S4H5_9NEIS|nr:hypothetical protein BG910_11715 [Neisseria chenwenguii]
MCSISSLAAKCVNRSPIFQFVVADRVLANVLCGLGQHFYGGIDNRAEQPTGRSDTESIAAGFH